MILLYTLMEQDTAQTLYDLEGDILFVVGSIVSMVHQGDSGMIVQYKADDNQLYKKWLDVPV